MFSLKPLALASGLGLLAVAGVSPAVAQSTDGFHAIQIFPLVVDSASFTQHFTFHHPDAARATEVTATFFPAGGSAVSCPKFTIPAGGQKLFTSLRQACPAVLAGSQYGYLYTYTDPGAAGSTNESLNRLFSGYSRVSNPQGNGFTVEAFPAHTFTSADTVVTGIRRAASTSGAPAYQSNCFIANLHQHTPAFGEASNITYKVLDTAGVQIGTGSVDLLPGRMVRLLDVFAAAGAPAGNQEGAFVVSELGDGEPGLMSFCTVQDNTSFGADFRIGKQLMGHGTQYSGIAQQDDHVVRDAVVGFDARVSGETAGRAFTIAAGNLMNTHVVYFRHPDWVQCELVSATTNDRLPSTHGLDIRLRDQYLTTLAGGAGVQGFGRLYLGDKTERNNGTNARYIVEVGSSTPTTAARPYRLRCRSGSGHTLGDIVRFNVADQF